MTKVEMKTVKCSKCGEKSQQMVVHSVNYSLGDKESNDKLRDHLQKCPNCGYEAPQIGFYIKDSNSTQDSNNNLNKYNISPENNASQKVYGTPDSMRRRNYDINPEDNQAQIVYGPPEFIRNNYDIKPEDNKAIEVYGIPKPPKNLKCPNCGSTNIAKYVYGMVSSNYNNSNYIIGGCEVSPDNPTHKCRDCNTDLHLKKSLFSEKLIINDKK